MKYRDPSSRISTMEELIIFVGDEEEVPEHLKVTQIPVAFKSPNWKCNQNSNFQEGLYFKNGKLSYFYQIDGCKESSKKTKEILEITFDLANSYNHFKKQKLKGDPLYNSLCVWSNKSGTSSRSKKKICDSLVEIGFGRGRDTSYFLSLGIKVFSFERDPIIYLLAFDSIFRWKNNLDPLISQGADLLELSFGSFSNTSISKFFEDKSFVIYYDPMFQAQTKKKSKSDKYMEFFKSHLAQSSNLNDEFLVLKDALSAQASRVILKRPLKEKESRENLSLKSRYSHSYHGKTIRYDVYI